MNEKAELLTSLRCLYDVLLRIENLDANKQSLIAEIQTCQQRIQQEQRRAANSKTFSGVAKGGATAGMIVGIVLTIIGLFVVYGILAFILIMLGVSGTLIRIIGFVFLLTGAGIVFLIIKGSGKISNASVNSSNRASISVQNNIVQYQNQIRDLQERQIPEADARLIIAYQDSQPLIEAFPPDYCYSEAVGRVIFFLENQRADTLKEALNLYENELYQSRMLAEQKKQTQAAQVSAKANVISAVANIATAFNTGQIAANTSQMVGSLRNIEGYSAQTAANSAAAARNSAATAANTAAAAQNTARAANSASDAAYYARQIRNSM